MRYIFILLTGLFTQYCIASTGQFDNTFGNQGVSTFNLSPQNSDTELAWDIAIGPDDKYYLAGQTEIQNDDQMFLVRFNEDGTVDTTFGTNGYVTVNFNIFSETGFDIARSIAIQNDGKIYLTGQAATQNGMLMAVIRLTSNGDLDNSFSFDGVLTSPINGDVDTFARGFDVKTDQSGSVFIAGNSRSLPALVKLLPNGTFDNSFNLTGKKELDIQGLTGEANTIHFLESGQLLVTGYVRIPGDTLNYDLFAAKLNANGTLDHSFNGIGYRILPVDLFPNQIEQSFDSILTENEEIIISGTAVNGNDNNDYDMLAIKLHASALESCFMIIILKN